MTIMKLSLSFKFLSEYDKYYLLMKVELNMAERLLNFLIFSLSNQNFILHPLMAFIFIYRDVSPDKYQECVCHFSGHATNESYTYDFVAVLWYNVSIF
jgi:hypothetical protein